jgi:hypothetical protein
MAGKSAKRSSNSLEEKIEKFVDYLNGQLRGNFVVAFQFISLDKVNGRNLGSHLYSIRSKQYIDATSRFIGLEKGEVKGIKRTVLDLEFVGGPYWIKNSGDSKIQEIPEGQEESQFISRLKYTYSERELEFDINNPPQSEPPPGKTSSRLDDLLEYWWECLQESIGRGGFPHVGVPKTCEPALGKNNLIRLLPIK